MPALQAALRAWRSEIARQRSVPAYVVLHDSTIDGIAAARPSTLNELRNIPGIGDKKLEHYGDELIALVRAADAESLELRFELSEAPTSLTCLTESLPSPRKPRYARPHPLRNV